MVHHGTINHSCLYSQAKAALDSEIRLGARTSARLTQSRVLSCVSKHRQHSAQSLATVTVGKLHISADTKASYKLHPECLHSTAQTVTVVVPWNCSCDAELSYCADAAQLDMPLVYIVRTLNGTALNRAAGLSNYVLR
eukprot:17832-Heterococcus_DN1.PRE.4